MDDEEEKDLQSGEISDIIPTLNEKRILQNLRAAAKRWSHGHFGPVTFFTHHGEIQYGILKETEEIETRI